MKLSKLDKWKIMKLKFKENTNTQISYGVSSGEHLMYCLILNTKMTVTQLREI